MSTVIMRMSDGAGLYVERSGEGTPCIYLHGGPGYWSETFKHFTGSYLEEQMDMIYLDQRGCGRSEHDKNRDYSLGRLVDDIEEVRKQLEIPAWYVMGHSFGGILALHYAHCYPAATRGIILTNATLHLTDSFSHQITKGHEMLDAKSIDTPANDLPSFMNLFYSMLGQLIAEDKYFHLQFKDEHIKEEMDQLDEGLNTDPSFQHDVFTTEGYFQDFTYLTEKIDLPVLTIAGKHDHAVGPEHHEAFKFPDNTVVVLDSGHHSYAENPKEFSSAVLTFLEHATKCDLRWGGV
ncbi:alpha/beta fold hydrolase [Lentibacillus sediminis]|uniref:alpha/beta fold hydrolase n=1 Tax=Lentibacillus sediminis TaxID=1940529 RepID=UPI001EFCF225|nr:alpha/beta hydrolase [Lentibacillus sediminis]